jgi:Rrf2 family protein
VTLRDVQISAKTDYALRAVCLLAQTPTGQSVKADDIAADQDIPRAFLDGILLDLRRAGLVSSRRGPVGGHRLARPPGSISVADVVRAMEGPLALVHGSRPEDLGYTGAAARLQDVWVALRAAVRDVLETTTLDQVLSGELPEAVRALSAREGAWTAVDRRRSPRAPDEVVLP